MEQLTSNIIFEVMDEADSFAIVENSNFFDTTTDVKLFTKRIDEGICSSFIGTEDLHIWIGRPTEWRYTVFPVVWLD